MELFVELDGKIFVNPEAKVFPEYRVIQERDKDRHKRRALQEFSYIWYMCDYKSPYVHNTSEAERPGKVSKELRFEAGWKPDADLVYAMERYKRQQMTASVDSLETTRESLLTANAVIKVLRKQIDEGIKDPTLTSNPQAVQLLVDNLQRVLTLSVSVPKMIDTISTLEEKIKKEQSNNKVKLKGGGEKGSYEE